MVRFVLVAALTPLLLAAPAQATSVTWPAQRAYAPGEALVVKVVSKRPVRVALVRESARGRIMRTIARKTLRTGTFRAAAPSDGRYALRVGALHRKVIVDTPVPLGNDTSPPLGPVDPCLNSATLPAAELHLLATSVAPGGSLPYEVVNTGGGCLTEGAVYGLERQQPDGSWARVTLPWMFPMFAVLVPSGGHYAKSAQIPSDAAPGSYRLLDDTSVGQVAISLSALFTVTG